MARRHRKTKRHSKPERQYWAIESKKTSIAAVAKQTGATEATIRKWRSEFKISDASDASPEAARDAASLASPSRADNDSEKLAGFNDAELAEIARRAADAYVEAHGEWFHDESRRQQDAEHFARIVGEWEQEHGRFTEKELSRARDRRKA
ncbi:hypothetical protein [Candidatus Poriferisodalis sp.]|uniref:hypothetical protein n=1 Tax=Candidatus Poriferisodalis sp. TaxID=3101277 RepID=UPI003B521AC2